MRIEVTDRCVPRTDVRQSSSRRVALAVAAKITEAMIIETPDQWGPCAVLRRNPIRGATLAVLANARDNLEVCPMLTHQSKKITQKTAQTIGIARTGQLGFCEALLQVEAKREAAQWTDGPGKTGSDGVGDEDLGVKPCDDESVGKRGAPQLEINELELGQQSELQEPKHETR